MRHARQPVCFRCYEAAKSYNNPLNPTLFGAVDLDGEGLPANSPRMKALVPANEMEANKMLDRDRYAPDPYRFAYNWREVQELTDRWCTPLLLFPLMAGAASEDAEALAAMKTVLKEAMVKVFEFTRLVLDSVWFAT